jgi:uncharacterized protein (TIGR00369 family)
MMEAEFEPRDPGFRARVQASFDRQRVMGELGASLGELRPGRVEIRFPYQERFSQQHGFLHAGIVATVLDSACGYAAFSLMPADAAVLSIEFKINLLAPAAGESFVARATVIRPGRTVTVCRGEVFAIQEHSERPIAAMQASMMAVFDREGIAG